MSIARPDTWMPWYIGDFLRKTMHLDADEDGAYRRLIDATWVAGGLLIASDKEMARITKLPLKKWLAVKSTVAKFFTVTAEGWKHARVSEELEKAERIVSARSAGGKHTAKKRWGDGLAIGSEVAEQLAQQVAEQPVGKLDTGRPSPSQSQKKDSEAIASAADAAKPPDEVIPLDTKAAIFGEQLAWLRENTGRSEKSLRSWLGQCCGKYGEAAVLAALLTIRSNPTPVEPISRMRSVLERQEGRVNGRHTLTPAESLYAGAALTLAERERARDHGTDSYAAEPLLDSGRSARSTQTTNG